MNKEEIIKKIQEKFKDKISIEVDSLEQKIKLLDNTILLPLMKFLKEELSFNYLMCVTGVDYKDKFGVIYSLSYLPKNLENVATQPCPRITIKTDISKDNPQIHSVSSIYKTAIWHEREVYDLFGIKFIDHPDLRRILLPDDWEGHPLRKDYVFPEIYHGIKNECKIQ
jgi:NADH-quinone oxidoreductase subunit C